MRQVPLFVLTGVLGFGLHPAMAASPAPMRFTVERATDWEALFDRTSGWTGSDACYSIPLSGVDAPGSAALGSTLFLFGDTFIGEVGEDGARLSGFSFVNNTAARLDAAIPDPAALTFSWGTNPQGKPDAVFTPTIPVSAPQDWFWPQDGFSSGGTVRMFGLRLEPSSSSVGFSIVGVSVLSWPAADPLPSPNLVETVAPLFLPGVDWIGDVVFGTAVMANTAAAGAPFPDGYLYVYGYRNEPSNKRLLAARVLPDDVDDFSRWRFWDGAAWQPDIALAAPLTGRVSAELSMTPLPDGRFLLVFQLDTISRNVVARVASSPIGPFGPTRQIWRCPEPDQWDGAWCYNAKAHPHLSGPGELIISYNVNTQKVRDLVGIAEIYRPRFIRVRVEP